MPKKIEFEDEEEAEEFTDEELEEMENEPPKKGKGTMKDSLMKNSPSPSGNYPHNKEYLKEDDDFRNAYRKRPVGRPPLASGMPPTPNREPVKRYSAFIQHPAEGIIDNESKEVVATNVYDALSDIIERLERIENLIGAFTRG